MNEQYSALANAIILKAVSDYRKNCSVRTRNEIRQFFCSEWFKALTELDGEMIMRKLDKERV